MPGSICQNRARDSKYQLISQMVKSRKEIPTRTWNKKINLLCIDKNLDLASVPFPQG